MKYPRHSETEESTIGSQLPRDKYNKSVENNNRLFIIKGNRGKVWVEVKQRGFQRFREKSRSDQAKSRARSSRHEVCSRTVMGLRWSSLNERKRGGIDWQELRVTLLA